MRGKDVGSAKSEDGDEGELSIIFDFIAELIFLDLIFFRIVAASSLALKKFLVRPPLRRSAIENSSFSRFCFFD